MSKSDTRNLAAGLARSSRPRREATGRTRIESAVTAFAVALQGLTVAVVTSLPAGQRDWLIFVTVVACVGAALLVRASLGKLGRRKAMVVVYGERGGSVVALIRAAGEDDRRRARALTRALLRVGA